MFKKLIKKKAKRKKNHKSHLWWDFQLWQNEEVTPQDKCKPGNFVLKNKKNCFMALKIDQRQRMNKSEIDSGISSDLPTCSWCPGQFTSRVHPRLLIVTKGTERTVTFVKTFWLQALETHFTWTHVQRASGTPKGLGPGMGSPLWSMVSHRPPVLLSGSVLLSVDRLLLY